MVQPSHLLPPFSSVVLNQCTRSLGECLGELYEPGWAGNDKYGEILQVYRHTNCTHVTLEHTHEHTHAHASAVGPCCAMNFKYALLSPCPDSHAAVGEPAVLLAIQDD